MIQDACPFDEGWYDWDIIELKKFIKENSKNDFVYLEFDHIELGRDEAWFEDQCRKLNNDLMKIKRELLLEWTIASDTSPFSEEQLNKVAEYAKKPIGKFYINKRHKFELYDDMKNILQKNWMIGIDVGGGLKRDFTAITISDPKDMKIKAVFKSNSISIPDLADLVIHLILEFAPNGVIIPERNTLGIALIQMLLKSEVANNMYYEVREKEGEKVVGDPKNQTSRKVKAKTRVYGIHTGSNGGGTGTRDIMINEILNNAVNETPEVFTSKLAFDELRTLERDKRNKIQHRDGCHDDVLFSWMVSCYALLYGKSAGKFFKILSDGHLTEEDRESNRKVARNISELLKTKDSRGELSDSLLERYKNEGHFNFDQQPELEASPRRVKRIRAMNFISSLNK